MGNGAYCTDYALGGSDAQSSIRRLIMTKARAGIALLAFLLPLLLNANYFIKNDLLTPKASKIIEDIGTELSTKAGIQLYVVATNEKLPERVNLIKYCKQYDSNLSKPYVIFLFAPNSKRIGLIPSSEKLAELYDVGSVKDAAIDVVAAADKNSKRDKYNIGIVQGYSELADQIADAKEIEMTKTIPNDTRNIIAVLKYLVIFGSMLVLWVFIIRPIYMRIKHGKK